MTDIYIGSIEEPLFHFKDDKIFSCSTVQTVALVGQELSIDTLTFSVQDDFESVHNITLLRSSDGETFETAIGELYAVDVSVAKLSALVTLEYGTPVRYYKNGELVGKFYIDYVDRRGRNMYQVNAVSFIGLLDKINDIGGVFHASTDTVGGILQKILAVNPDGTGDSIVDYEMDEDVSKVPAYCYLPYATKRQNLYQIMTAYGVNVIKGLNGNPHFTFIHTPVVEPQSIAVDNIYQDGNIEYERPYTQAIVTEHEYLEDANISTVTLFDNTRDEKSVTKQEIRFSSAPIVASTIHSDRQGLTIQAADDNRAIVSGVGVLTGKPYAHITNPVFGSKSTDETRAVQIQNCTAINVTNSQYALNRLKSFYMPDTENRMITRIRNSFVYSGQRCGKLYTLVDPFGESVTAYLAQMTITASGKDKVDAVFYVGYKPPDLSGLYNHSIIIKPPVVEEEDKDKWIKDITDGIEDNEMQIRAQAELSKAEAQLRAAEKAAEAAKKDAEIAKKYEKSLKQECDRLQAIVDEKSIELEKNKKYQENAEQLYEEALEYYNNHPDDEAAKNNFETKKVIVETWNQIVERSENELEKADGDYTRVWIAYKNAKNATDLALYAQELVDELREQIEQIKIYIASISRYCNEGDYTSARRELAYLLRVSEVVVGTYITIQSQADQLRDIADRAYELYERARQEWIDAEADAENERENADNNPDDPEAQERARQKEEEAERLRQEKERLREEYEDKERRAREAERLAKLKKAIADIGQGIIDKILGNETSALVKSFAEQLKRHIPTMTTAAKQAVDTLYDNVIKDEIGRDVDDAIASTVILQTMKVTGELKSKSGEQTTKISKAIKKDVDDIVSAITHGESEKADRLIENLAKSTATMVSDEFADTIADIVLNELVNALADSIAGGVEKALRLNGERIAEQISFTVSELNDDVFDALMTFGGQAAVDIVLEAAENAISKVVMDVIDEGTESITKLIAENSFESAIATIQAIQTQVRVAAREAAYTSAYDAVKDAFDEEVYDPDKIALRVMNAVIDSTVSSAETASVTWLDSTIYNICEDSFTAIEDILINGSIQAAVSTAANETVKIIKQGTIDSIPDSDLDDTAEDIGDDAQNQGEQIQGDADGDAEDGVDDALNGAIDDEIGGELDDKADGAANEAEGESEEDAQHIQDDAEEEYSGDFDELSGLNDETDQAEEEARRKREEANRLREEADADPTNPEKQAAAEQAEDEADEAEEQARQKREERDGKRDELADELAGFIADGLADGIAENVLDKILDGLPDDIAAAVADALADILGDVIGGVVNNTIAEIIAGVIADIIATIAGEIASGGANENAGNNADELGQKATELENLADELEEEAEQARAAADADPGNEELEEKAKDAEEKAKKARGDAEAARAAANAAGSLQNPDNLSDAEREARAAALEAATEAAKKVLTEAALDIATEAAKEAAREAAIEAAKAYIQEKLDGILESLLEGAKNAANQAAIEAAKAAALNAMELYPDDPEKVIKAATDAARKAAAQAAADYIANAIKALLDDDEFRDAVKQAAIDAAIDAATEAAGDAITDALPDAIDAAGEAAAEGATGGANDGFKRGEITLPDEIFDSEHPSIRVILIGGGYAGNDGGSGRTGSTTSAHTHFDGDLQTVWYGGQGGAGGQGGEGGSPGRVLSVTIDNPERTYTFRFGKGSDAPKPEEPEQEEEPETEPQSEPGENDGEQGEDQGDDEEDVSEQATIFGELTSEDEGSSIPESGVYDPFTEEYYAVKGKPGINGGAGGARKVDTGDGGFNWITSGEDVQDGDTTYYGGRPGNVLSELTALPEAKFTAYGGNGAGAAVGIDRDKNYMLNGGSANELIVEYDVEFESVGTVGGYAFGYGFDFVIKGEYIANERGVYRPRHAYLQGRMLDHPMRISEEAVPALENVGGTLTINEVDSATQSNDVAQIMASVSGESRRSVYIGGAHAGSGTRYTPTTPEAQTINGGGGQGGHGGSGGAGSSTVVIEDFKINGQDPTQYAFIMPPGQGGPGGRGGKGGSGCIIILYGGDTEENE